MFQEKEGDFMTFLNHSHGEDAKINTGYHEEVWAQDWTDLCG